ncbi:hypothetical protein P3342_004010 [Pyrenophora teres f. teres]|uniref:DUF7820 domain-containing protein n=1 Tax=Pyrenophora teres f. teres TaxID=97479 RepID=A0A6S6VKL8_9PLEO|nr:hypothetical protein P3342_004010 [Pyrenophora teres f. teres]CAE7014832.1 hypothetical protein PTTW11_02711 [Pyrenophora teres f. teres]
MRLPHRSISSIQPLPSIYTTFPASYDSSQSTVTSGINSGTCLISRIEDGIEVAPFERVHVLSAPILSPDQEEKEVFVSPSGEIGASEKPLPDLPGCIWNRMSLRQRILAFLTLQFILLVTIGCSLLAVKRRSLHSDQASTAYIASDIPPDTSAISEIRRGIFALPIQVPQKQSSACLARMNESIAWTCAFNTMLQLSVLPAPAGDDNATMVAMTSPPNINTIHFGEQMPDIPPVELLELENNARENGSAYYFRATYDRVVLLREDEFTQAKKRQARLDPQHTSFLPGESLWQCTFKESIIKGYLYVKKPTKADASSTESNTANTTIMTRLPLVPYSVKLVEERLPNGKTPYCEKMLVERDATLSSQSQIIDLSLSNPQAEAAAYTPPPTRRMKYRIRDQEATSNHCQCQWLIQ